MNPYRWYAARIDNDDVSAARARIDRMIAGYQDRHPEVDVVGEHMWEEDRRDVCQALFCRFEVRNRELAA